MVKKLLQETEAWTPAQALKGGSGFWRWKEVRRPRWEVTGCMIPGGRHAGSGAPVGRDGCGNTGFGHIAECPDVVVAVSPRLAKC